MDDLAGILIPMLLAGANIMDILKAMAKGGGNSVSNDGLSAMILAQTRRAVNAAPLRPSESTLRAGAGSFVDRVLGVNPLSGPGQGLSNMIAGAYGFAPGIIGNLIGVPSPGSFFSTIANGASGISMASRGGMPDLFNPYSTMEAHKRAMGLAKGIYDIATEGGKGYDESFGHGLNFSEMGHVAQRILSSRIAYTDDNGRSIDPTRDADEFRDRMKKFGSKINEAVSMMNKVTGSLEDTLKIMDSMGGGNFLGGTAQQASDVARRAKDMAAAIRITSAMSGINPREAYGQLAGMQQGLARVLGADPAVAAASGLSMMLMNPAYQSMMASNMWAAENPDASPMQRQQAMMGAQYRMQAYFSSPAFKLVNMVSANKDQFSKEDLDFIEKRLNEGNVKDVVSMVKSKVGEGRYYEHMNSPQKAMADYIYGNKEIQNRLHTAGVQGNLTEAEIGGAGLELDDLLVDSDVALYDMTGENVDRTSSRENAAAKELRKLATKHGLSESKASTLNLDQLRRYLRKQAKLDANYVERIEKGAMIDDQIASIESMTMSSDEDEEARKKLRTDLEGRKDQFSEEGYEELSSMIDDKNVDISVIFDRLYDKDIESFDTMNEAKKRIFGGKMSGKQARDMSMRFAKIRDAYRFGNTPGEWKRADEAEAKRIAIENTGALFGTIGSDKFNDSGTSDREALKMFSDKAAEMSDSGTVSIGGDDRNLSSTFRKAYSDMVSNLFGGRIGDLNEKDDSGNDNKAYSDLVNKVSSQIAYGVNSKNMSIQEAMAAALEEAKKDKSIGKSGVETIEKWQNELKEGTGISRDFNRRAVASRAANLIGRSTMESAKRETYLQGMLIPSGKGSDKDRLEVFAKRVSALNSSGLAMLERGDGDGRPSLDRTLESGMETMFDDLAKRSKSEFSKEQLDHLRYRVSRRTFESVRGGAKFEDALQEAFRKSAVDSRAFQIAREKGISDESARKAAEEEMSSGKLKGVAKEIMDLAEAAKTSPEATMGKVMAETMGVMGRRTAQTLGTEDITDYVSPMPFENERDALDRFAEVAKEKIAQGLLYGEEGDEATDLEASLEKGAAVGMERILGSRLKGMEAAKRDKVKSEASRIAVERFRSGKSESWDAARREALKEVAGNGSLGLKDKEYEAILDAASDAGEENVGALLSDTAKAMVGDTMRKSGDVGSLYALMHHNPYKDDKKREEVFTARLDELRKSGMLSIDGEDENLTASRTAGARSALDAYLGSVDGKAFDDKWKQEKAAEIAKRMAKDNIDVTAATKAVMDDAKKGESGARLAALESAGKTMDGRSLTGKYLEGMWKNAAQGTAKALYDARKLSDVAAGGKGLSDKDMTSQFSEALGELRDSGGVALLEGDGKDAGSTVGSGVTDLLSDVLKNATVHLDISSISKNAVDKFNGKGGGDWKKAILRSLDDAAKAEGVSDEQKKALNEAKKTIKAMDNVGPEVLQRTMESLGISHRDATAADASQYRNAQGYALYGTADVDSALKTHAASQAQGMRFNGPDANGWSEAVSKLDDEKARSTYRATQNALDIGGSEMAKKAIERTKQNTKVLRDKLKESGISDAETLQDAIEGKDKKAEENLKKAISGTDEKEYMAQIKALSESKIGGKKGFDVLFGDDKSLEEAYDKKNDKDWTEVTKEKGRQEDPNAYQLMSMIGGFADKLGQLFDNPLPVKMD